MDTFFPPSIIWYSLSLRLHFPRQYILTDFLSHPVPLPVLAVEWSLLSPSPPAHRPGTLKVNHVEWRTRLTLIDFFAYFTMSENAYLRPAAYHPDKLCLTALQVMTGLDSFWSLNRAAPGDIRPLRVNPVEDVHSVASHLLSPCCTTLWMGHNPNIIEMKIEGKNMSVLPTCVRFMQVLQ